MSSFYNIILKIKELVHGSFSIKGTTDIPNFNLPYIQRFASFVSAIYDGIHLKLWFKQKLGGLQVFAAETMKKIERILIR